MDVWDTPEAHQLLARYAYDEEHCIVCGGDHHRDYENEIFPAGWACEKCRPLYPPSLIKAMQDDDFQYLLGLRDGVVILFVGAKPCGTEWVRLRVMPRDQIFRGDKAVWIPGADKDRLGTFYFDRGIDVKVSEIAWCCDAPWGS